MKNTILASVILTAGLMFASVSGQQAYGQSEEDKPVVQEAAVFTCSMHSDVAMSSPGKCPACGMDLKEKVAAPEGTARPAFDSTAMKHEHMDMKKDTAPMKTMKMTPDTIVMKKAPIKSDTIRKKEDRKER